MSEKTANTQNVCGICNENTSKYCCPRCEIFYCSLNCYKAEKHLECSESFYRECVNEELALNQVDDESKRKMIEILKKMQPNGSGDHEIEDIFGHMIDNDDTKELSEENKGIDSDDDDGFDLHERIKDINLDDPNALWNVLTEDEKNEFEAILNEGDVGSLVPHWEPWWMYCREEKLIEDVDSHYKDIENKILEKCPPLLEPPKFSSLATVQPSPAIVYNIANVLSAYAFAMRYFNGEVDPVEGAAYMLCICTNLNSNTNFEDLATAVESVAQKCLQSDLIATDVESLEVMENDTVLILQGPSKDNRAYYCKAALSDLHKLLSDAKTAGKSLNKCPKQKSEFSKKFPDHTTEHLPGFDVKKVKMCMKKLEYYLSFIESQAWEGV